jgi:hypothetical protein
VKAHWLNYTAASFVAFFVLSLGDRFMKTATARFLLLLFALAPPALAAAQQGKGDVPVQNQYLEIKTLPLPLSPGLLVSFLDVNPQPLGEPPLVQWNAGVKVTDGNGKTLAEMRSGNFWRRPFVQDVIVVHEEPVILIGDSASLTAPHYSSGNLVDVGSWAGGKVELQPLSNGDFKIVISDSGPGEEDLPNVFQWDGVSSHEDSQARTALLRQVLKKDKDEVENSPDEWGSTHRWSMDCFRDLHAAAILGNRTDALQLCSRARHRIEAFSLKYICGFTQPDCNERSRKMELEWFDSGMLARNASLHELDSEAPPK